MSENKEPMTIDIGAIIKMIWAKKMLFVKILPAVFILSCFYILSIPRYYTADTKMAPEMDNPLSGGTLGDIASTLGFNFGEMQTSDAITPLLYPDLMEDNKFVTDLFKINVESQDGNIKCNYYEYLKRYQKYPWWNTIKSFVSNLFTTEENKDAKKGGTGFDPYRLSRNDDNIAGAIRNKIKLNVDKKTGVISISTESQDPLISKTLADSVRNKLQDFITEYRTNKARTDLEYYRKLRDEAKLNYEKARRLYGSYADANSEVVLESYRAKQNDLENDMQLKYNNYTAMVTQYQAAKAKVQERTPAFTMLKGANVPIRPAGPKRMFFVVAMLLLATIAISIYAIKDIIIKE